MQRDEETSWTLIEDAAAGDVEGRIRFARDYEPVLQAYLRALLADDPQGISAVDDLVQEIFLECFRCGGVLEKAEKRRTGGFRAFMYGVARNVAHRFRSRRGAAKNEETLDTGVRESSVFRDDAAESAFDRAWAQCTVRRAMSQYCREAERIGQPMSGRYEILRLRFQDDLPIREIAPRLGLETETAHREYATARREFEAALRKSVQADFEASSGEVDRECRELLRLLGA